MTDVRASKSEGAEPVDSKRRERVKARWSMLRQALLGSSSNGDVGDGTENDSECAAHANVRFHKLSMNSFPGFQVLSRTILGDGVDHEDANCGDENWDVVKNSFTSTKGHTVYYITRESKAQQKQTKIEQSQQSKIQDRVQALLSHRNYGVDNTGNVRVWDAEGTLAGFLLSVVLDADGDVVFRLEGKGKATELTDLRKYIRSILTNSSSKDAGNQNPTCNLLELGAGQAGLAGLAMPALTKSGNYGSFFGGNTQIKPLHVVLSDGHPKCVDNNRICAEMISKSEEKIGFQVEAHLLLWDSSSRGAESCRQTNVLVRNSTNLASDDETEQSSSHRGESRNQYETIDGGMYQLCLASDCVHFQEFHDGLLTTIARTLVVGGIALLCQPKRGTSLGNFMALVDIVNTLRSSDSFIGINNHSSGVTNPCRVKSRGPLFQMTLLEDFNPKVSAMHKSLLPGTSNSHERTATDAPKIPPQHSSQYNPDLHRPLLLVLRKLRSYDEEIDGELARHHTKMRGQ